MAFRINPTIVPALFVLLWPIFGQDAKPQPSVTGSFQTGLAETFQLTLGGTFGEGPTWQSRATVNVNNVFQKNDAVVLYGWSNLDVNPNQPVDRQTGFAYKMRLLDKKNHVLTGWAGYQYWNFPGVLTGTEDHLVAGNLTYNTRWKVPLTVTADTWRTVSSRCRLGTILYPQAWATFTLWRSDQIRLVLRPTVATTYSWHFWDRNGLRVFRYGGTMALESPNFSFEGGVRQQVALQPGIPENTYWSVSLTRNF